MNKKVENIYDRLISSRLSVVILVILMIALVIFGYFFYKGSLDSKLTALYGGLVTSLVAVVIQFLMGWNEHREIENFKKMGILKVLPNRDGKQEYYYKIIQSATKRIDFLGSTANTFLKDFGNTNPEAGEKVSALTRAMKKGVKVRFLLLQKEHLGEEKQYKFNESQKMLSSIEKLFPDNFKYYYLSEIPSYTLVTADGECIVGTIIPSVTSDITSAIHAHTESPYLKCYLEHFENEWKTKT